MRFKTWIFDEKIRFLVVGGVNTAFGYGCFIALYRWLGEYVNYLVINIFSHFISVFFSFSLYRRFVFLEQLQRPFLAFVKYNVAVLNSLGSGLVLMYVFVQHAQFSPVIAQAFVMAILTLLNYVSHKYFTFK